MQYLKVKGLNISKLTLGTVQLGMEYGIANKSGKPDFKTSFRLLQAAVDGGVNSFDTAEGYGDSEAVLGNYLSSETCNIRRPVISTKFEIIPEESISSAKVEKQIYRFMEQSLQRLKISRIPIYMHNPRDMTKYGKIVPETMGKLKREGLIEKAGVSVYTSVDIDGMLKEDV
ncbi:MAG: aldo/keto reductase, partial [Ruminiclostridium sp.]|nr:aldo/keto reductase [Ruminiclostridium sp.]